MAPQLADEFGGQVAITSHLSRLHSHIKGQLGAFKLKKFAVHAEYLAEHLALL